MSDFGPLHQQAVVSQQAVKGESGSWDIQAPCPSADCGLTVGAGCEHPVGRLAVRGLPSSTDRVCPLSMLWFAVDVSAPVHPVVRAAA